MPTVHPPEEDSPSERRAAFSEVNRRRVNEAIERGQVAVREVTFICECGLVGCTEKLQLTIEEYEDVRTDFDRFLVAPGHVIEDVETVAEDHGDYLVAVKHGVAAEVAEHNDPRGERA
jgi:hypothetical protein